LGTRSIRIDTEELDELIKEVISGLLIIDVNARHRITGTDDPSIAIGKVIEMLSKTQTRSIICQEKKN
jgi:hypothetical protein